MEGKRQSKRARKEKKEKEVVEEKPAEDEMQQEEEPVEDEENEDEDVNENEDENGTEEAEDETKAGEEDEDDEAANWESLGLEDRLVAAAKRQGWGNPSPVQEAAIPLALAGRDLLVRARTGSGKTAAYSLPIIHAALMAKEVRVHLSQKNLEIPIFDLCILTMICLTAAVARL
jgi:ATP-dependent RNA helicase DDX56/DBP9